jgi:hypothetical protein
MQPLSYSATRPPSSTLINACCARSNECGSSAKPGDGSEAQGPGPFAFPGGSDRPKHLKQPHTVWDRLDRVWHWAPRFGGYRHDHKHGTELKTAAELLRYDPAHVRPVKVLTVWQPWASCIAAAATNPKAKTTENRDWSTQYRGLVAIHAGKSVDHGALAFPGVRETLYATGWAHPDPLPGGSVIALANLTDCHRPGMRVPCCLPWGMPGQFHWSLSGVVRLAEPVPCRGFVGLFTPPQDVAEAIARQVVVL